MAKYTKEEKQKAIDLYIRYCRQATKVIKELGYPNKRHTLVSWYRGYEEKGEVKDDGREEKSLSHVYSEKQVKAQFRQDFSRGLPRERKKLTKPVLDKILETIDRKYPLYTDKNELGKDLAYLRNYKSQLYVYLDHLELTPDDNVCL